MPLTDYVIMPSADYTAACDKIREKSGKTAPIKSGDLAAEIEEVAGGVGNTQEKTISITENGTTEVLPDNGYALSKVTINANVKQNYCAVRFYNDDRTTLLYTAYVPYGGNAVYAGEAPTSTLEGNYQFTGFEPSAENVTADLDCYAEYEEMIIGTLDETSWATISALSDAGIAENYFAVGDCKAVALKGTIGTLDVDKTCYVYIIGFNHNNDFEGNGIHFGTFKTAATNGIDIALVDSKYNQNISGGTMAFNISHYGASNDGGWAGCDMRYDILGSTDIAPSDYGTKPVAGRTGYDASVTCATNPIPNTLMAALPADLREVMKPMTKYTDNGGGTPSIAESVTKTIDYLPLLAEYEIYGTRFYGNYSEQNRQIQYDYYKSGNGKTKNKHSNQSSDARYWTRSVYYNNALAFLNVSAASGLTYTNTIASYGLAPIFKV